MLLLFEFLVIKCYHIYMKAGFCKKNQGNGGRRNQRRESTMAKKVQQNKSSRKQIDYQNAYNRKMYKQYHFRVRKDDKELIDAIADINQKKALSSYIRDLIRKDIGGN